MSQPSVLKSVIWVSSFPKSGNTWVQSVIRRAGKPYGFPTTDLDVYKMMAEGRKPASVGKGGVRPEVSGGRTAILKTHSIFPLNGSPHAELELETVGFVYVIRNPLDMLLSYINFTRMQYSSHRDNERYQRRLFIDLLGFKQAVPYEKWVTTTLDDIPRMHLDHALERFSDEGMRISTIDGFTGGSWVQHAVSWMLAGLRLPSVIVRYEDLLLGPEYFQPLQKIFTFTSSEIASAVQAVNERQRGLQYKKVFYNKMSSNYFKDYFSSDAIARFCARYQNELVQIGYSDLMA